MASQPLSKIEAFTYLRIARNLNAQRRQKKDKTKDIVHMGSGKTGEVGKWQKKTKTGKEQKVAKNTKSGKVAKKWQDRKSAKKAGHVGKVAKKTANPFPTPSVAYPPAGAFYSYGAQPFLRGPQRREKWRNGRRELTARYCRGAPEPAQLLASLLHRPSCIIALNSSRATANK